VARFASTPGACTEDFAQQILGQAKPGPVTLFQINLGFPIIFTALTLKIKKHHLPEVQQFPHFAWL
jgi:hypothetical protein